MLLERHPLHEQLLENERCASELIASYAHSFGDTASGSDDAAELRSRIDAELGHCRRGMMELDLLMEDSRSGDVLRAGRSSDCRKYASILKRSEAREIS